MMDSGLSTTLPEENISTPYNPNIREMDVGGQTTAQPRQHKRVTAPKDTTSDTFDINAMRKQIGTAVPDVPSTQKASKVEQSSAEPAPKPAPKRKSPVASTAAPKKKSPTKLDESSPKKKKPVTASAEASKRKAPQKKSDSAVKKTESKPIQKFTPTAVQNKSNATQSEMKEEVMAIESKVEFAAPAEEKEAEVSVGTSGEVSQMNLDAGAPVTSEAASPSKEHATTEGSNGFTLISMDEFKAIAGASWNKMVSMMETIIIKKFRNSTQVLSVPGTDIRIYSAVNTSKPDMPAITIGLGSNITTVQYIFSTMAIRDMTSRVKMKGNRLYYKTAPIFATFLMNAPTADVE